MCSEALWNEESGNVLAPAIVVACVAWWDLGLCLGSLCLRVYGDLEKRQGWRGRKRRRGREKDKEGNGEKGGEKKGETKKTDWEE